MILKCNTKEKKKTPKPSKFTHILKIPTSQLTTYDGKDRKTYARYTLNLCALTFVKTRLSFY